MNCRNASPGAYGAICLARKPTTKKTRSTTTAATPNGRRRNRVAARRHRARVPLASYSTAPRLLAMLAHLARRVALTASAVIAVSFIAFVSFGLSFDPTYPLRITPDQRPRQYVVSYYHLSDPILSRYWRWASGLTEHGFGTTVSLTVTPPPMHLAAAGNPIGPAIW